MKLRFNDSPTHSNARVRAGCGCLSFNDLSTAKSPTGVEHDVISLPQSVFHTVGEVLSHTTTALDGDAGIHLSRIDTIKVDGVTEADLLTHPNVFHA